MRWWKKEINLLKKSNVQFVIRICVWTIAACILLYSISHFVVRRFEPDALEIDIIDEENRR